MLYQDEQNIPHCPQSVVYKDLNTIPTDKEVTYGMYVVVVKYFFFIL